MEKLIESNSSSFISSYKWTYPNQLNVENIIALFMIIIGILFVYFLERSAVNQRK